MTDAAALGHDWADATCTEPQTCRRCKKTTGSAKGHNWAEATYETPSTCTVCGVQTGNVKGYTYNYLSGTWNDSYVFFGYWNVYPLNLSNSVENCRSFNLNFRLSNITSGSPYGEWELYGKNERGKWVSLGKFDVNQDSVVVYFEFGSPVSFSSIAAIRCSRKACAHLFGYWLTDVQLYVD